MPPSQFLNKNVYELLPTALASQVMKRIKAALSTGEVQLFDYRLPVPYPSGPIRDYEARIVAIDDDDVLAIIRELTKGLPKNNLA